MEKETSLAGDAGFMRLDEVLKLLPFGKSRWFSGVRRGEFPKPVKYGRVSLYRRREILALVEKINGGAAA